jgi:hypothetical protein
MTLNLPNLNLNLTRKTSFSNLNENKNETKNENNNNISNTIIINKDNEKIVLTPTSSSKYIISDTETKPSELSSIISAIEIPQSSTPAIIKLFKDYLLLTLINYFKEDLILINNVIELSKQIVMKEEDLKKLIAILVTDDDVSRILINSELPSQFKCCNSCSSIPIYKKISSIIIDKKYEFKITYNQFYTQMQTEFNISLDYILNYKILG